MKQQILALGKDSVIYGVGSVVTRFIGLITLPLFTAYLSPAEYGVLAMLSLLTMVAQPVFNLGVSAAMGPSYFGSDSQLNKSKAVWTAFAIILVSSTLLVAIAWLFPALLGQLVHLPADYYLLISISLTGCALTILVTPFILRMQFEKQAKLYVIATLATSVVAIVTSIFTVVTLGWGVMGMVVGQLAGNAITFFAFFLFGLKGTTPRICLATAKELLRQGLPLVPGFAFLFILMHSNKYILEQQIGLDAVGVYSIGFNLGTAISIVTGGIATAWYPFFMGYIHRQEHARSIFGRIFTYYFFSVGLLCVAFFVFAEPVVQLLTNEKYKDAYTVVGFVALANFSQVIFNFFLPPLYFFNELKRVSLIQGFAAFASLPVNYFLIEKFAVLGAGIGLFIGHLFMALFLHAWNELYAKKLLLIDYDWRRVIMLCALFALIVLCYFMLPSLSLAAELFKSIFTLLIAIAAVYFLLNDSERGVVMSNINRNL